MSNRALFDASIAVAMERASSKRMQYGVDDCALWVADIQAPILDYDPAARVRGRYKTRRGAARIIGRDGLLGQLKQIARRHKWTRIAPTLAQPGDTGLAWTTVEANGKQVATLATVICRAPGWFFGRNEGGWTALRADKVSVAWSVFDDCVSPAPGERVSLPAFGRQMCPTPMARHEPVSTFIGLSALINGALGLAATATLGGAIGGFVVATALSIGVSIHRDNL